MVVLRLSTTRPWISWWLPAMSTARAVAGLLPTGTAWQRFERALQREWVEWVETGNPDALPEVQETFLALRDPEERLRGEVALAAAEARRRYAAGDDWQRPLAEVRPRLSIRGGILRSHWLRPSLVLVLFLTLLTAVLYAVL